MAAPFPIDWLATIRQRQRRVRSWPWALALLCIAVPLALLSGVVIRNDLSGLIAITGGLLAGTVRFDRARRATVLTAELNPAIERSFARLVSAFGDLQAAEQVLQPDGNGNVTQRINDYGMNSLIGVTSNLQVPFIATSDMELWFLPDQMVAFPATALSDASPDLLSYTELTTRVSTYEVAQLEQPSDAAIVGYQWEHHNKDGSRDLRRKENRQVPVAAYEVITLQWPNGIEFSFAASKKGAAHECAKALKSMASALATF